MMPGGMMAGGMMPGAGWWGGFGVVGWLAMIVVWVLLVAGIAVFVRWLAREAVGGSGARGDTAMAVLKERYARGEIGREEYEARRHDLA